jgi:hypothetical protein
MASNTPPVALPDTRHSTFYSYIIAYVSPSGGSMPVGSLESLEVRANRQSVERIREVYYNAGPITNEIVWGGVDISLDARRVELYDASILQAFGFNVTCLEMVNFVVSIMETRKQVGGDDRIVCYSDCVPESWGRTIDTGTARIVETMTFQCRTMIHSGS